MKPTSTNETDLAEALISRSKGWDEMLYRAYASRVLAIARRYVGGDEGALDVTQNVFLAIFSSRSRFQWKGPGSLTAWISRIAVNEALAYLKHSNAFVSIEEIEEAETESSEPEIRNLSFQQIVECIDRMPTIYRVVFNLYYLEHHSHEEISSMLDIKISSSASRLSRARAMLADIIKKTYGTSR